MSGRNERFPGSRLIALALAASLALPLAAALAPAPAAAATTGIRAGLISSKLTNDVFEDSDRRLGLAVGVYQSYEIVPGVSLQPELLYVQKGGEYDFLAVDEQGLPIGSGTQRIRLHYLEVPVLLRVGLPVLGSLVPSLMAGPSLAFKVGSSLETEVSSGPAIEVQDDLDWVDDTDFGLVLGVGFDVQLGVTSLQLDLRYDMGLFNINEAGPAEINNRGLMLLAGIGF